MSKATHNLGGPGASVDGDPMRVRIRTIQAGLSAAAMTVVDWRTVQSRYGRKPSAKAVAMLRARLAPVLVELETMERDLGGDE